MKKILTVIMAIMMLGSVVFAVPCAAADDAEYNMADLFAKGDIDCNGSINSLDLAALVNILLDKQQPKSLVTANVDNDAEGKVNTKDLINLKKKMASLEV